MPRFPSAQGRLNHEPGFHLSCDENLSEGWGPPLPGAIPECEHPRDWVAEGAVPSEPVSPRIWARARRVLHPRLCPRAH